MSRSAMKNVNAVTMVMNVWLIVSEQETQEIQRALENAEQLQLQHIVEAIRKFADQLEPTLDQLVPMIQSLRELFSISYDNELYVLMFEDFPMYHSFISSLKSSPVAAACWQPYFSPEGATKANDFLCISILAVLLTNNFYIKTILLPRDAVHKRGLCRHAVFVRLSARLSVCVFVTFVDHVKTNKHIVEIFSPSGRHTILVFQHQTGWRYSYGNPLPSLTGASNAGGVGRNRDSEPISGFNACC